LPNLRPWLKESCLFKDLVQWKPQFENNQSNNLKKVIIVGWVFSLSWTSLGQLSTSSWLNHIMQDFIVYSFILNATYPKWSFILL
jgi:hypothetical protein